MNVGYAFWGFMADEKRVNGNPFSSPDGNFFYSWALIKGLMGRGHTVTRLMPDRDWDAVHSHVNHHDAFRAFATHDRHYAYLMSSPGASRDPLDGLDVVIIEWRMPIPGRNTWESIGSHEYQPDLLLQDLLIEHCHDRGIPVIAFDLDYKMTLSDDLRVDHVIELGWKRGAESHVEIPFDFSHIGDPPILPSVDPKIVYIGNRYERDWAVDKYLSIEPSGAKRVVVHGNWLERGRGSNDDWPHIEFGARVQPKDFYSIYSQAAVTPLLAKREYVDNGFMTVRVIEAAFYGSLPLQLEEFNSPVKYLPEDLVVGSAAEVEELAIKAACDTKWRINKLHEVREGLRFMDGIHFADRIQEIVSSF